MSPWSDCEKDLKTQNTIKLVVSKPKQNFINFPEIVPMEIKVLDIPMTKHRSLLSWSKKEKPN